MVEVEAIPINNINYVIFDRLTLNNTKYVYLVNENDETDFRIQKIIIENEKEFIKNLDNEEEFKTVFNEFAKKQKNS